LMASGWVCVSMALLYGMNRRAGLARSGLALAIWSGTA
jgi:hypothetical protein